MGSLAPPIGAVPAPHIEPLCRIITPVGMLGYGFDAAEVDEALALAVSSGIPTALVLDSGSTDGGPNKLAIGTMTSPRAVYKRDLAKLLRAVRTFRVPLLIGSAGGDGSDAHVREFLEIIGEILADTENQPTQMKVLAIYSEVDRALVLEKLEAGHVSGCGPGVPTLIAPVVAATPTIVGQMGPEPYLAAMAAHPDFDVIIGGRAYDPAPYVAFCAFLAACRKAAPVLALDPHILGGFTHMGKIMECGGVCATPKSHGAEAVIYTDGTFDVRPLLPGAKCTPISVAAHTLYEKTRPDVLFGPGGAIDLTAATYAQLEDGISVRARGTVFRPYTAAEGGRYTIKLEGARVIGYRTLFMGSFSDPVLIAQLPYLLARIRGYAAQQHAHVAEPWELGFHVYGSDDATGTTVGPGSVFLIAEALAADQATATSIAAAARVACIHGSYPGQKATSGNFGWGIGGRGDFEAGPCAEFSLYHLMELDAGEEEAVEVGVKLEEGAAAPLFRWEAKLLGTGKRTQHEPTAACDGKFAAQVELTPALETEGVTPVTLPETLGAAASIIRSKNAGPYEITFDVLFDSAATYERVKALDVLTPARVAALYDIAESDILYCGFFDQAHAFKVTVPRMRGGKATASGGFLENDVHGSQQYLPLLNLRLDGE